MLETHMQKNPKTVNLLGKCRAKVGIQNNTDKCVESIEVQPKLDFIGGYDNLILV